MVYDMRRHFWLADDGRVFDSARELVTNDADPVYTDWIAKNYIPTPWPRDDAGAQTNAALQEVLTPYNLFVDLVYYAADARWRRQNGGITVAGVTYRTDRVSENERNAAYNYSLADPAVTFQWKLPDGTFVSLTNTQLANVALSEGSFVQECFACEKTTINSINIGTITTRAEVDAAFAAISNVFP